MKEFEIRNKLDNIVGALVYFEQTTGANIPQGIFDELSKLEGMIFNDRPSTNDRQYEIQFTSAD